MNDISESTQDKIFQRRAIEASIRVGLIVLLLLWCFNIVKPFVLLILWGAIIAVAIYPLFLKFSALLGNRLPGAGTLYHAQSLNFHGRAQVGDTLKGGLAPEKDRGGDG